MASLTRAFLNENIGNLGNGIIGKVANAQAGLNHSDKLTKNQMFNVSDVVDASNYNDGNADGIYNGLLERYCELVRNGEPLAASAAVYRVIDQASAYWDKRDYGVHGGSFRELVQLRNIPWITECIEQSEDDLKLLDNRLWERLILCNGPLGNLLVDDLDDEVKRTALTYDRACRARWAAILGAQGRPTEDEVLQVLTHNREDLIRCLQETQDFPGELFCALQQIEALSANRWQAQRPMRLDFAIIDPGTNPNIRALIARERRAWLGMMEPQPKGPGIVLRAISGEIPEGARVQWHNKHNSLLELADRASQRPGKWAAQSRIVGEMLSHWPEVVWECLGSIEGQAYVFRALRDE